MKRTLTLLSAILLTILSGNVYAEANKIDGEYNIRKAHLSTAHGAMERFWIITIDNQNN